MNLPDLHTHMEALVAVLADAGVNAYGYVAPFDEDADPHQFTPYTVVEWIPGGGVTGDLTDVDRAAWLRFDTISVGSGGEQADWQGAAVRQALHAAKTITVPDRAVYRPTLVTASGGVDRDHTISPPLYSTVDRWSILTVPAEES